MHDELGFGQEAVAADHLLGDPQHVVSGFRACLAVQEPDVVLVPVYAGGLDLQCQELVAVRAR